MAWEKTKTDIGKMSISNVDRILLQRYKITKTRTQNYPEDIKRDLLFDLETHLGKK